MKAMDAILEHLDKHKIPFQVDTTQARVEFFLGTDELTLPLTLHLFEPSHVLLLHAYYPALIPQDKRSSVMEFLTRANYGLRMGNFEMDLDDGEVRFKNSARLDVEALTEDRLFEFTRVTAGVLLRYHMGIGALTFGDSTPREEIYRIEEG